jgi:glycosyltransferase involved in cell wall biosynthesis
VARRQPKRRLGVLVSAANSPWISCNSISTNLVQAYKEFARTSGLDISFFSVCPKAEERDLRVGTGYFLDLADKISAAEISDVVFLDHHIDPLPILLALRTHSGRKYKDLRFSFHIYGDFTLSPQRWFEIGRQLTGTNGKLICASERQRQLVSFFEPVGKSIAEVCPFAVNTELFRYSAKSRTELRGRLGISEAQTLLLYTGRISMQKCVLRLIQEFAGLCAAGKKDVYLALAGPVDDLGGMTTGISIPPGYFFHQLTELLAELPKRVRDRIFFLGHLAPEELKKTYSAADLFVSLSLHHDEDFGMCPAEALSSGLPSILTDWGGYASFSAPGLPCELVPVQIGKRGVEIDAKYFSRVLANGLTNRSSPKKRSQDGSEFENRFGLSAIAGILSTLYEADSFRKMTGFSWSLEMAGNLSGTFQGDFYRNVYGKYVKQHAN